MLKVGDYVIINQNLSETDRLYTVNETMRKMIGNIYKVDRVINTKKIKINGWVWSSNDVSLNQSSVEINSIIKSVEINSIIKFDIKNLDLESLKDV